MKNLFKSRFLYVLLSVCMLGYIIVSCNKAYEDRLGTFGDYDDSSALISNSKKVLYIIVDGANGQTVKGLKLYNINKLAANGTYTWNSLAGIKAQDSSLQASWSNLMTGVNSEKSNVSNSFDDNSFSEYPTFISRLKAVNNSLKISVASTSSEFDQNLGSAADSHQAYGDDQKTADALVDAVKGDNDIVVGEFNGAYQAGLNTDFDLTSSSYIDELEKIDGYLGNIVNALKSRANYSNERWLVIITSTASLTHDASESTDPSLYSNSQLNTFTIISNPNLNESYIDRPADTRGTVAYKTSALRFRGDFDDKKDGDRASITDSKDLYNCPPGDSLTVEAKIKINPTSSGSFSYSYPPFISKVSSRYGNYTGWSFFRTGNNISFFVGLGDSKVEVAGNTPITDNAWHTIAGRIIWDGTYLTTTIFIDGVVAGSGSTNLSATNSSMINNTYPLVIGYWPNVFSTAYLDSYIKDVRIWKTALTDAQVASYSCFPSELLPSSLPMDKLVGDFRLDKQDGDEVVVDYSSYAQNGVYQIAASGKMEWTDFNEISNAICPTADDDFYNASMKGVDMPYEIFTWMGVMIDPTWQLDGKFWQPSLNTDSES